MKFLLLRSSHGGSVHRQSGVFALERRIFLHRAELLFCKKLTNLKLFTSKYVYINEICYVNVAGYDKKIGRLD